MTTDKWLVVALCVACQVLIYLVCYYGVKAKRAEKKLKGYEAFQDKTSLTMPTIPMTNPTASVTARTRSSRAS